MHSFCLPVPLLFFSFFSLSFSLKSFNVAKTAVGAPHALQQVECALITNAMDNAIHLRLTSSSPDVRLFDRPSVPVSGLVQVLLTLPSALTVLVGATRVDLPIGPPLREGSPPPEGTASLVQKEESLQDVYAMFRKRLFEARLLWFNPGGP